MEDPNKNPVVVAFKSTKPTMAAQAVSAALGINQYFPHLLTMKMSNGETRWRLFNNEGFANNRQHFEVSNG